MYCYKNTHVLKNKLGIKDSVILKQAESDIVFAELLELEINPLEGNFDKNHLYRIHYFLFKNIYEFAGKTRKEDIAKGNTKFCLYEYIDNQLDKLFDKLKEIDTDADLEKKDVFSQHLAYIMAELNIIHPFREGNGRAIREFVKEYAAFHNYIIDWSKIDKISLLDAMVNSIVDNSDLKKCIYKILKKT